MEKEFEHLTEKLENIHLLVQSDNFSEEHCNMIFNYSHELKLHNLRLSQMLAELPEVAYSVPQISEPCNMRNAVEYVDREHAYALNHNSAHLNLFSGIDISALLMNIQQLLMERIDLIITCITLEHSNLSLNHLPNDKNNVIGNIHFFNDVNSKMDIMRELYSLSVRPTSLQHNLLLNIMKKKNVIVCGNRNDKSILFIIPLLHDFRPELNACQALVIVPTWEIAVYVKQVIESLRNFLGLDIHLFEGENHNPSVVPHIEVGLPGELQYKLTTENIKRDHIRTVIVIGMDKLWSYIELIYHKIIMSLPRNKHITMILSDEKNAPAVADFGQEMGLNPSVCIPNLNESQNIFIDLPIQYYFSTKEEFKIYFLSEINNWFGNGRVVVFCNSLDKAQELCVLLYDLSASLFYIDMDLKQRNLILQLFTSNKIQMLFTLDSTVVKEFEIADCVIYYDFPTNPITYLNTITKFVTNMKVVNFINENDLYTKRVIETICKSSMTPWPNTATKYV